MFIKFGEYFNLILVILFLYLQGYKYWGSSVVDSKMKSTSNEAIRCTIDLDSFSSKDKEKILKVINSKSMEELSQ
jgi:hypothetical protein